MGEQYTWAQYLKDAAEFGFEPEDQDDAEGETTVSFLSRISSRAKPESSYPSPTSQLAGARSARQSGQKRRK